MRHIRKLFRANGTRIATAAVDTLEVMERAQAGLQRIVKAIEEHPGTGQAGRLVRFLAGVYNGGQFPFDLTDLRALDTELANACIDYLNYDRNAPLKKMWRSEYGRADSPIAVGFEGHISVAEGTYSH